MDEIQSVQNGIQVFGTVITGVALEKLRENFLILSSTSLSIGSSSLSKLNNMFGWSSYRVKPSITTVWNRYDNGSNKVAIDFEELDGRAKRLGKKPEEHSGELKHCELKLADKEEILSHYKRLVEEGREVMKEKSKVVEKDDLIMLLKEVLDEKN